MKNGRTLALFDFDGTITKKDTFLDFFMFVYGPWKIAGIALKIAPFIILHFLKIYSGKKLKELFFAYLIKGWSRERFVQEATNYYEKRLKKIIKTSALNEIKKLKNEGVQIVVVTASAEEWVVPFTDDMEIDIIATELEIAEGLYTGNIKGKNCRGDEKVKRIDEKYDTALFDRVFAYGDSSGDKEMLDMATEGFYRNFK